MRKQLVIKFIRQERGLTQQQLAEKVKTNRTYISAIESGKVLPTLDTLLEIARVLNCLITDLYKEDLEIINEKKTF